MAVLRRKAGASSRSPNIVLYKVNYSSWHRRVKENFWKKEKRRFWIEDERQSILTAVRVVNASLVSAGNTMSFFPVAAAPPVPPPSPAAAPIAAPFPPPASAPIIAPPAAPPPMKPASRLPLPPSFLPA